MSDTLPSWYEEAIEPGIRNQVRLMRDNGFNTTSSCGHVGYVELTLCHDGELMRLDYLLFNEGYRNYAIESRVGRTDGHLITATKVVFASEALCQATHEQPQPPPATRAPPQET